MKNIVVLFGGVSCEHDISVITGVLTLNALPKNLYNAVPVFVSGEGKFYTGDDLKNLAFYKTADLKKLKEVTFLCGKDTLYEKKRLKLKPFCKVDVGINCLHGLNGEDGTFAGLFRLLKIPFASPDIFQSAFTMDKDFTKTVLKGLSVKTLPYMKITAENYFERQEFAIKMIRKKFGYPVIVKPANLGSSIGITVAKSDEELLTAFVSAFKYDEKVIVEPALENFREINCAVYKKKDEIVVSELEEPLLSNEILTFSDKYLTEKTKKFPAETDEKTGKKIKEISELIYRKLDFNGVIRIDFLIKDGEVFVNEINSVPGSLAYYLFCKDVGEFKIMLDEIIKDGEKKFAKYAKRNFVFDGSGVFKGTDKFLKGSNK